LLLWYARVGGDPVAVSACQATNAFKLSDLEVRCVNRSQARITEIAFRAHLTAAVRLPYLEGRATREAARIPAIQYRKELCRRGVLRCPGTPARLTYAGQFAVPSALPGGAHALRLIFREGCTKLACFERTFLSRREGGDS